MKARRAWREPSARSLRLLVLPGGFHLLVGHDIEDHMVLRDILRSALGVSLFWLALVGALGGLFVAHRVLERVDVMSALGAAHHGRRSASSVSPSAGAGDELDRLAENFNAMLERIERADGGIARGFRQYRP